MKEPTYKVQTISQLHEIAGIEKPKHPLITVIDFSKVAVSRRPESATFICSFIQSISKRIAILFMTGRLLTTRKAPCFALHRSRLLPSTGKKLVVHHQITETKCSKT